MRYLAGASVGRTFGYRRIDRCALLVLVAALLAAPAGADWPAWRGPDGLGVVPDGVALPTTWEPEGDTLRWRTAIPGDGNSSPIVSGDRVFVTTAYQGSQAEPLRLAAMAVLAICAVLLAAAAARRRRRAAALDPPRPAPAPRAADGRVVTVASALFVVAAAAIHLQPELFYSVGNPGRVWRATGALALLGVAAAAGWSPVASRRRLWGALGIFAGAGVLAWLTPSTKLGPAPLERRIVLLVPAIALGLGYLVGYLRARRRGGAADRRWIDSPVPAVPLLLLAALVFVPPNFLHRLLRVVVCVDLDSGEIVWERPALAAPPEQKWRFGTFATPTPAADDERVYAHYGVGLAALDHDGEVVWRHRFREYVGHTRYGAASSPVMTDDAVIVVQESEMYQEARPSWIAAFDRESGETRWRIEPADARDSYSTPLLVPTAGASLLLTPSWEKLVAYDAATGERRWEVGYPNHQMVASIARQDDLIVLTGGVYDEKRMMALRIGDDGAEILWETNRLVAGIPSPVLYRGLLFVVTEKGILACYQPETGKVLWKERLDGEHYASLLAGDGKVYATNREGVTSVIAAKDKFELLAKNELGEPVMASPAVAEACLLIRTERHLVCIEPENGAPGD